MRLNEILRFWYRRNHERNAQQESHSQEWLLLLLCIVGLARNNAQK